MEIKNFNKTKIKGIRIIIYFVAGLLLFNLILLGYGRFFLNSKVPQGYLRVIFLDVGQGDAALIQNSQGYNILVDGGPNKNIIYYLDKYIPFYNRKIDLMISTHSDSDHLTGLVEVLNRYQVKEILTNGLNGSSSIDLEEERLIKEKGVISRIINAPADIVLDKKTALYFLWPPAGLTKSLKGDDNSASLVFVLEYGEDKFLFTGDAPIRAEEELIKGKYILKSDVLKVAHHGSKNSSSIDFLKIVNPDYAVISVGLNSFGHPSLRVLNNLEKIKTKVLRTDEMGDVVFLSDGEEIRLDE